MPTDYYRQWLKVAAEKALHFSLLAEHLVSLGHAYGDFDAHDGLWTMVKLTSQDVLARLALVPRTLEARGLDATPPMQDRLRRAGDLRGRNPGDHPARRGRPRRHRQLLVSLAVPARRTRSGADLRPVGAGTSCATTARPLEHRGPACCRLHAWRSGRALVSVDGTCSRGAAPRAAGRARPFTWRDVRHTGSCGQGRVPCRARSSLGRTAQEPVALLQV